MATHKIISGYKATDNILRGVPGCGCDASFMEISNDS